MFSKQLSMMAVLFSIGLAAGGHAACHDALSPEEHALQSTTAIALHQTALNAIQARQDHIVEEQNARVNIENQRHNDELARLTAERAAKVAAHTRATNSVASDRTDIHTRFAALNIAPLPSADPAVAPGAFVGGAAPVAPASITGAAAALQARNTADARHELEAHNEELARLDQARETEIASHNWILLQMGNDVRAHLEEARRAEDAMIIAHEAHLVNLGQRLQRWIREQQANAAQNAITAANTARTTLATDRAARRNAALTAAGGRV